MLVIGTWLWGRKYSRAYVDKLRAGFKRHLTQPHRFEVFTPSPEDWHLTKIKGCFVRLRMFDPAWQAANGIGPDDRIVCCDLDCVITGQLDPLFNRAEPFMILQGANATNPCPYNGSLWMLRAGYRPDVWTDFDVERELGWLTGAIPDMQRPYYEYPDDQGWFAHKLPKESGWKVGPQSGVYAYKKPHWPKGDDLPGDARMVVFPGWRDPSKFTHLPWIKENWR